MRIRVIIFLTVIFIQCKTEESSYIFKDLCESIEASKNEAKPTLINYSALGLGYNEFYSDFLTEQGIKNELIKNFVVVELNIDDPLVRENTLQASPLNCLGHQFDKQLNYGELNLQIQNRLTNTANQPLYQIVNQNFENVVEPFGYTSMNKKFFKAKLLEAKENYKHEITKTKLEEESIIAEYLGMMCDCPQWKLLTKVKNANGDTNLIPLDTIEIIPLESNTINPLELANNNQYQFIFVGKFYRDIQIIKYEDGQKVIKVKTFVYSEVNNLNGRKPVTNNR